MLNDSGRVLMVKAPTGEPEMAGMLRLELDIEQLWSLAVKFCKGLHFGQGGANQTAFAISLDKLPELPQQHGQWHSRAGGQRRQWT